MKNFTKKIFSCFIVFVMMLGFGSVLFACGEDPKPDVKTTKVMNLTLNPSIELVLDKNNNVVTVNANNDEGNFIISQANFVSLSADQAVEKFLEIAKDNGFLEKGDISYSQNRFVIEISGNNYALYQYVVDKANKYLEDTGFSVNFVSEKIVKSELQNLVRQSMKELPVIDVLRMSEEQLIAKIKESREETKDIYSQELKNLYYILRGNKLNQIKFEEILNQLDETLDVSESLINSFFASLDINLDSVAGETNFDKFKTYFQSQIEELEEKINNYAVTYKTQFLNGSDYQTSLSNYISAKRDLLEARINNEEDIIIESYTEAVEAAYEALYGNGLIDGAFQIAENAMEEIEDALTEVKDAINNTILLVTTLLENTEIDLAVENAKNSFYTEFSTNLDYSVTIANSKSFWNALKPELKVAE